MSRALFTALCGLVFFINFGRVAFAPLVPEFQADLGLSAAAVGSITTLVWLGTAAPRLPVGYILTRVPRRYVVLATGGMLTVSLLMTAMADSLLTLQAGAFAVGLSTGGYFVAAIPLVGVLYPNATGRALGIHGTAAQSAAVAAPAAIVLVLARTAEWRVAFLALAAGAAAVTVMLVGLLLVRGLPRGVDDGGSAGPGGEPTSFRAALNQWRIVLAGVALVAGIGFAWQGLFNFYVTYLLSRGLSSSMASNLLTVAFAAGVPAFWFGGRLADRLPEVPYLLGIHIAFVVLLAALTTADGVLVLALLSAGLGLAIHAVFPAVDTYMLSTLPKPTRASAYAVFSGIALLLEATGSGAVGLFTDAGYSFDTVFLGFAAGLALLTIVLAGAYVAGRFPTRIVADSGDSPSSQL